MGLGSWPTFSVDQAKQRARQQRQKLEDKIDPIEARRADRDARKRDEIKNITFKAATEKYLAQNERAGTWRNAKHGSQWTNTLRDYAFPVLGERPVRAIDALLINHALGPSWARIPETASRTKQRIERIIAWVKAGMPPPVHNNGKRKRHHPALPYDQMPEFMAELRVREGFAARALEFAIFCACRTGDIIGNDRDEKPPMQWSDVDLAKRVWTIPSTKTDTELRVPLSDPALGLLKALPRLKGSGDLVFPGDKAGQPLSNAAMSAVLKRINADRTQRDLQPYVDPKQRNRPVTVHGFRSTFKDWSVERTSYPHLISEMALSHVVKSKTEAAYLRSDLFVRRVNLMRDWSRYCTKAEPNVIVPDQAA